MEYNIHNHPSCETAIVPATRQMKMLPPKRDRPSGQLRDGGYRNTIPADSAFSASVAVRSAAFNSHRR